VDLLTAMISYGPSPLPNEFTEQMFPGLMQLAWSVPDIDLLQSAQECLKTFIVKDIDHIMRWFVRLLDSQSRLVVLTYYA
jgi:hypothetical protein